MNKENLSEKKYSNFVTVTSTPTEVYLSFKLLSAETPTVKNAENVVTVVLPPSIAISLINVLRESVKKQVELLEKRMKTEKRKKK